MTVDEEMEHLVKRYTTRGKAIGITHEEVGAMLQCIYYLAACANKGESIQTPPVSLNSGGDIYKPGESALESSGRRFDVDAVIAEMEARKSSLQWSDAQHNDCIDMCISIVKQHAGKV